MAMGQRIQQALDHLKLKQTWLCERAGIDAGALSALIRRDSKRSEFSGQIADALGLHHRWLQSGDGPMFREARHQAEQEFAPYGTSNILPAPPPRRAVPVLSMIQAGDFADINCQHAPGEGDQWETPDFKLGPRGWAHIVSGESMYDGTEASFRDGSLIFCDPDVAPTPNAFVIAKDIANQTATFKQLVTDAGKWYLRPLNRQFPIIEIDDPTLRVIAVVTEARNISRKLT